MVTPAARRLMFARFVSSQWCTRLRVSFGSVARPPVKCRTTNRKQRACIESWKLNFSLVAPIHEASVATVRRLEFNVRKQRLVQLPKFIDATCTLVDYVIATRPPQCKHCTTLTWQVGGVACEDGNAWVQLAKLFNLSAESSSGSFAKLQWKCWSRTSVLSGGWTMLQKYVNDCLVWPLWNCDLNCQMLVQLTWSFFKNWFISSLISCTRFASCGTLLKLPTIDLVAVRINLSKRQLLPKVEWLLSLRAVCCC